MNKLIGAVALSTAIVSPSMLLAATINTGLLSEIDVGQVDTYIVERRQAGSPASETNWVRDTLGDPAIDWTVKQTDVLYERTNLANTFAFELDNSPEYFLVKNSTWMALFQNNADYDWGVIDTSFLVSDFNIGQNSDQVTISHVLNLGDASSGGPRINQVPEPVTWMLLLSGFIFGFRKKLLDITGFLSYNKLY